MPKPRRMSRNMRGRSTFQGLTLGTVVDTNDPQQMGRLRVLCPTLGDDENAPLVSIPWASYVSPFGGIVTRGTRGPEESAVNGPASYGMWAIPKVGAYALVACLDDNPQYRIWLGCIHGQFLPHTLPAGRYLDEGQTGPVSSTEQPIEPLASNLRTAFSDEITSYEWLTRAAELQAAGVSREVIDRVVSERPDERDDAENRQGYQTSRQRPDFNHPLSERTGGDNLDSQVYAWTTPGLHSIVMDDSLKNGRIRFRSTSGHQVILDDTNERIYISTAEGNNWIEMDRNGNIDVYSERRVSVHAKKDINFTTEEAFRVSAKSIHLRSQEDTRIHADQQINMLAKQPLTLHSNSNMHLSGDSNLYLTSQSEFNVDAGSNVELKSGSNFDITSGARWHLKAAGEIALDGSTIHLNSGNASPSAPSGNIVVNEEAVGQYAYTTNRVPIHEPWGRIMNLPSKTDNDTGTENEIALVLNMTRDKSSILELSYDSANANKVELGETIPRNSNWRR